MTRRPDCSEQKPIFGIKVDQVKRMRWAGSVARMVEMKNAYYILVGKPEGKISLRRARRRWEDNIRMDLREIQ
jgi:hypothetical protein